jgi:hypothetical protein|nr:MAG TPA: hypothetical protein [Caudoviricetes sp.]
MIKVLKEFYDLKAGIVRKEGDTFEGTKERFDEINTALPEFVEWEDKTAEVTETSPYYV